MKPHIPVYRPILKHALETAWTHRELWPIAAVAGLAGTGAVVNDVINQAKLAAAIPTSNFSQVFGYLHVLGAYKDQLMKVSIEQLTLGTFEILGLALLIVLVVAACQQAMLRVAHTALKSDKHLSFTEIRQEFFHPRLFRFLTLDIFLKLMIINLMISTTVLVTSLDVSRIVSDAVFGIVFSAAALSLALTINVLVMLALMGVARKDMTVGQSLMYAWGIYRRHSVVCLEMSMLLFAVNFLISAAYDGTILALGVPAALSLLGALELGSFAIYLGLLAVTALIVVTLTVAFAGFATTFTYSAWAASVEHLGKKSISPRAIEHTRRFIDNLRA